jgi:N-acetylglucosaminyl-diphospho-decaprenol L-rhamnosyltransferase
MSAVGALDRVTVVITNWGTPDYTIRSAQAVIGDGVPPERVVVVDNGSQDDSYERFRRHLSDCVLVSLPTNIGFGRASNLGAAQLSGDSYLFVNNDAFVHEAGSIARMLEQLGDERIGLVVPRLRNTDLSLQKNVVPSHRPASELARASGLSRFIPNSFQPRWSTHWDHGESREIDAAIGAVMLLRGETWQKLGGFDERIHMYAEDLDLCWRTRQLGWKVWFCADAEFVHVGNAAASRAWTNPRRAELVGRSEAAMIRRHHSPAVARLTIGLICAGLGARLAVHAARRDADAAANLRGSLRGFLGRADP